MPAPILTTKLFIPPPRPNAVVRPRLIGRLDAGLRQETGSGRRLTLVSAPAGFGKTTLVSEWVARADRPVAWLSLDEGDSDPARFLAYLVAALQNVGAGIGRGVVSVLDSPQPPPTETMLTALVNELAALPDAFVVVLDDYHLIDSKPVEDALAFLIDHHPPQMHLVIATREDPQLPLARYRARGQLTELRAVDLRFTAAEAAGFLNEIMGLDLPPEDILALETRTEGWIAGLQLAALALQGRAEQGTRAAPGQGDAAEFIRSFAGSHHFVMDYLVEEVLQQQPDAVQAFLLQTSVLDRLCGPLCDAVQTSPGTSGQTTLEYLERANLLIIPLDDVRRWFRYHHLFADALQARLAREQPGEITGLHRRASEWYSRNGFSADAIRHALAAKDFERAAKLIELEAGPPRNSELETVWLGWARALPDDLVRARPVLSMYVGFALLPREIEAANAHLRDAERWLEIAAAADEQPANAAGGMVVENEAEFRLLPATIAVARAYIAGAAGDAPGIMNYARQALDRLPEGEHFWRGAAAALLGIACWASGDLETAYDYIADARTGLHAAGGAGLSLGAACLLAWIRLGQGRLRAAQDICERAQELMGEPDGPAPQGAADLLVVLGEVHLERNDLEGAVRCLERSKELGELAALLESRHRWSVAMGRIKQAQGDTDAAMRLFDEAERLYLAGPNPEAHPIAALKARLWAAQGRLAEALGWVREQSLSVGDDLDYLHEFDHITLARVLIAAQEHDETSVAVQDVMRLLERLVQTAGEGGRIGSVIESSVVLALALHTQGNLAAALLSLERALRLAGQEGFVQVFVAEGPPMAKLLSEAVERGIAPGYAGRLLAIFETQVQKSEGRPLRPGGAQPLIEPLSDREIEILRLIALGLSNREISERLFLALSTVKGHNQRIFDKLQVQRRTEAIARARALGLL